MKKIKREQFDNQIDLSAYFDKEFQFKSGVHRKLPTKIFESKKWAIPAFQQKKTELNQVKEQLGKFNLEEWSKHTKSRDPSSRIIRTLRSKYQIELLTQVIEKIEPLQTICRLCRTFQLFFSIDRLDCWLLVKHLKHFRSFLHYWI